MKKIGIFIVLLFLFLSKSFAFDIFSEISDTKISLSEPLTLSVEILNNQDFDENSLQIEGIENFSIHSQNLSIQSMSFNGVSSYKKQISFTLQPKKSGKFTLQPTYKTQTDNILGEKYEIIVQKGENSENIIGEETISEKFNFGFEIWLLGFGILIFLFFTKFYKPQKNLPVLQDLQNSSQNNGFFDNYIWSESMDYTDLRNIFVKYLENYHGFSGKFGGNYSEILLFIENINLDTKEKNAIKSIILLMQSSEFSSDKVDKKDLFYKILELKNFNNSI